MNRKLTFSNACQLDTKAAFVEKLMSLAKLNRNREKAIGKLEELIKNNPDRKIRQIIDELDVFTASQIENIYRSVIHRETKEYQGYKLGEQVQYVGATYNMLSSTPLTIVEFDLPTNKFDSLIVICIRTKNGTYAPDFEFDEIRKK